MTKSYIYIYIYDDVGIPARVELMTPTEVHDIVSSLCGVALRQYQCVDSSAVEENWLIGGNQIALVLHIESLLPMSYRMEYLKLATKISYSNDIPGKSSEVIHLFRRSVLTKVLEAFNAVTASDDNAKVVDNIVEAFALLSYLLPNGFTTSSPFPLTSIRSLSCTGIESSTTVEAYQSTINEVFYSIS